MILSHLKLKYDLKTEDGQYFQDIFQENNRIETKEKKLEWRKDIVQRLIETIYLQIEPLASLSDDKYISSEKDRGKTSRTERTMNFLKIFKTKEHLFWNMEIIGYGFGFVGDEIHKGINLEKVYMKALEIYKIILKLICNLQTNGNQSSIELEKTVYPVDLVLNDNDKQRLFREIFSHLSLSFENLENLKKADFCNKVISLYNEYATQISHLKMQDDTWEFFLKLLIGVTDHIIEKRKKMDMRIQEELCHNIVMTLLNAWIYSGMRDSSLWKTFSKNARNWQNIDLFLKKWNSVCIGLTCKVLGDKYGLPFYKLNTSDKNLPNFLCIAYDKLKRDRERTEVIVANRIQNLNSYESNELEQYEKLHEIFWANMTSDQAVFLWYKFLHLFEQHPCEKEKDYLLRHNEFKFYELILATLREIITEILKIGYGPPKKILNNSSNIMFREYLLKEQIIKTMKCAQIKPRREKLTKCCMLIKSNEFDQFLKHPLSSSLVENDDQQFQTIEFCVSDQEKSENQPKVIRSEFLRNSDLPIKEAIKIRSEDLDHKLNRSYYENSLKFQFCTKKVAKGNDILDIFSKWLFEYAGIWVTGYDSINQNALEILIKIFRKARGPFKEEYILKLYILISEHLKRKDFMFVLKICSKLFQAPLPGVTMILKEFCQKFDLEKDNLKIIDPYNKYLSNFLKTYLGRHAILLEVLKSDENKKNKYLFENIVKIVKRLVEQTEKIEKSDKFDKIISLRVSLWILFIHSLSNSCFSNQITIIYTSLIDYNRSINYKHLKKYLLMMVSAAEIYHLRKLQSNDGFGDQEISDIGKSISIFMEKLSEIIRKTDLKYRLTKENKENLNILLKISSLIIQGIYLWLTLPLDKNFDEKIIQQIIEIFLEIFQNTVYEDLNEYSALIFKNLLNNIGKTLCYQNTTLVSTAISEIFDKEKFTNKEKENIFDYQASQTVRIHGEVILSIYLGKEMSPNEDIVIFIRNCQGKYIWQGELIYKLFPNKTYQPSTDFEACPYKTNEEINENLKFCLMRNLNDNSKEKDKSDKIIEKNQEDSLNLEDEYDFEEIMEKQLEIERDFENNYDKLHQNPLENHDNCIHIQKQIEINNDNETRLINITKLFLFQYGLLDVQNSGNTIFLNDGPDLRDSLKELDCLTERNTLKISCYFIENLYQIDINNLECPDKTDYNEFIESISCYLDESSLETGMFESVRNEIKKEQFIYFSSTILNEIVFLQCHNLKSIKTSKLFLIWNARNNGDKYDNKLPNFLKNFFQNDIEKKYFIIITPLSCYLYKINVFKIMENKDRLPVLKDCHIGPLYSKMLVPKESLGLLVKATFLNIARKYNLWPLLEPQKYRKKKINEIVDKFINKEKTNNFLSILNLKDFLKKKENSL